MRANKITLRLSPVAAKILWQIVDGVMDAGACKDGLTPQENRSLQGVVDQLLRQIVPNEIDLEEPRP